MVSRGGKQKQGEGAMDRIKGKAKDAWGSLTGDKSKQAEGKAEKGKGTAKQKTGEAQERVDEQTRRVEERLAQKNRR